MFFCLFSAVFIKGLLDGKSFSFVLFFTIIIMSKTLIARLKNILRLFSPIYLVCLVFTPKFPTLEPGCRKRKGSSHPKKYRLLHFAFWSKCTYFYLHKYQKYNILRCLSLVKDLVICVYLGWSGSTLPIRTNIIKVGSKLWLLTRSNITLKPTTVDPVSSGQHKINRQQHNST